MKKTGLLMAALFFLNLFDLTYAFAWQGRMAGTGEAYGLISDESDFLIHPVAIGFSKDLNMYGTYKLTYDKTTKWNNNSSVPSEGWNYPYEVKGHEWKNESLAGMAFPQGAGRMGIFFEYLGKRAKYDGDENYSGYSSSGTKSLEMKSNIDNFILRAIYGIPVNTVKIGVEIQLSHRNEENLDKINNSSQNIFTVAFLGAAVDLLAFMIPFRSDYYESLGKLSVEGTIGPVKNTLTFKGGAVLPFASNNRYNYKQNIDEVDMSGDASGWNAGLAYWLRVPLNKDLSLPFVVGIGHKSIKRDGSGNSNYASTINYEHKAEDTNITAGGGADFNLTKDTKIAGGLYYDYIRSNQDLYIRDKQTANVFNYDYPNYPQNTENRITLTAMTGIKVSPGFSLLSGINAFYGRFKSNYHSASSIEPGGPTTKIDISTSGYNWGANISFGTTHKIDKVNIEPFFYAGFRKYKVDGDGVYDVPIISETYSCNGKTERTDWIIGGGLSVKY